MGWIGELSSLVLSMGQKLISQAEKAGFSDSCSSAFNLDNVDAAYKPFDPVQL